MICPNTQDIIFFWDFSRLILDQEFHVINYWKCLIFVYHVINNKSMSEMCFKFFLWGKNEKMIPKVTNELKYIQIIYKDKIFSNIHWKFYKPYLWK